MIDDPAEHLTHNNINITQETISDTILIFYQLMDTRTHGQSQRTDRVTEDDSSFVSSLLSWSRL